MLNDAVEVLKVLPNKAVDATILWDGFEGAIGGLVHHYGTTNGYVIDIGYGELGNLWLKDVHHIIVEDGDSVSPTHQEFGEMEHIVRCLEGGVVARHFGNSMFIIANIKVKLSSTGTTCKLLGDLFSERSDTRMLDGNGIEGFETVDWANGISFFLHYAEPARAVQRVGVLIYAGIHLRLNNLANFVVDTQRYWNVSLNPGGVCNDGDFNRWKEVLAEVTALRVVPSESFILEQHEMV